MAKKLSICSIKHPEKPFDARCFPSHELRPFARDTVNRVINYFRDPKAQADFERWLIEDYSKRPGVTVSECYTDIIAGGLK